jgi:hypothetical protein
VILTNPTFSHLIQADCHLLFQGEVHLVVDEIFSHDRIVNSGFYPELMGVYLHRFGTFQSQIIDDALIRLSYLIFLGAQGNIRELNDVVGTRR